MLSPNIAPSSTASFYSMEDQDFPIPTETCMVIVLGETGSGKSYFIRKLTSNAQVKISHNLESCTQNAEAYEAQVGGTSLLLIDTPGFDDSIRSDGEIILEIASSLAAQSAMGVRLLGIIYMHDITVSRMRGSLKRELEMLRLIAGPRNYRHILLVTTKWGDTSRRREFESRQFELEDNYWDDLMQGGAEVHRYEGTAESARAIVSQLNFGANAKLSLQKELEKNVEFRRTAVGKYTEQVRLEKQTELQRISSHLTTDSSAVVSPVQNDHLAPPNVRELETSLRRSASDAQTMNVRLNAQVKEWIREAVTEEKKRGKTKPTVAKAMASVLAKMVRFIRGHDGEASNREVVLD